MKTNDIIIKQVGPRCELHHGPTLVFTGGRVEAKKRAKEIHLKTGDPVWNWKANNTKCEVYYKTPVNK